MQSVIPELYVKYPELGNILEKSILFIDVNSLLLSSENCDFISFSKLVMSLDAFVIPELVDFLME